MTQIVVTQPVHAGALALLQAAGEVVVNPGPEPWDERTLADHLDEAAVAQALEQGRLGAYAADVFEMEDWNRPDRPREIHPALLRHPATVFTPHLGSAVARVHQAIELRAAHNLVAQLQGLDAVALDDEEEPKAHDQQHHGTADGDVALQVRVTPGDETEGRGHQRHQDRGQHQRAHWMSASLRSSTSSLPPSW